MAKPDLEDVFEKIEVLYEGTLTVALASVAIALFNETLPPEKQSQDIFRFKITEASLVIARKVIDLTRDDLKMDLIKSAKAVLANINNEKTPLQ